MCGTWDETKESESEEDSDSLWNYFETTFGLSIKRS